MQQNWKENWKTMKELFWYVFFKNCLYLTCEAMNLNLLKKKDLMT